MDFFEQKTQKKWKRMEETEEEREGDRMRKRGEIHVGKDGGRDRKKKDIQQLQQRKYSRSHSNQHFLGTIYFSFEQHQLV